MIAEIDGCVIMQMIMTISVSANITRASSETAMLCIYS